MISRAHPWKVGERIRCAHCKRNLICGDSIQHSMLSSNAIFSGRLSPTSPMNRWLLLLYWRRHRITCHFHHVIAKMAYHLWYSDTLITWLKQSLSDFFTIKLLFSLFSDCILCGRKSLHRAHTLRVGTYIPNSLRVNYLQKLFRIILFKFISSPQFIFLIIYLYQYKLTICRHLYFRSYLNLCFMLFMLK